MRQVLAGLAIGLLISVAVPAGAQQGSMQVSASAQAITGDPQRIAGQNRLEPDLGITWLQPGSRFGILQLELHAARRQDRLHAGKTFLALRDFKMKGVAWSVEAGDTHFTPAIGEYRFSNLFTPAVTFSGAAVTGRTKRSSVSAVAGRTSAWRNIFGNDPESLGQTIGSLRATHKPADWLEVTARASRVRTSDLKEFSYSISASDQAGGGFKASVTSSLQLAADASVVSYRRAGSDRRERDMSGMLGASWLHRRGWVQVNASRFSAGDFPTLNAPLPDREGVFAAGDYTLLPRLRVFAGLDLFRTNLRPASSLASTQPAPRTTGSREFGGARLQLTGRSTLTLRGEWGDRVSRPLPNGFGSDTDTGSWAAEWHAAIGGVTTFARYSRRDNVDRLDGGSSFTQHDVSGQLFANVSRRGQLFAIALMSRNELPATGGSTYWQFGGGGQFQVSSRGLSVRAEGTLSRNIDLLTQHLVPRESMSVGLNGQLTRHTTIAFNVAVDRSPMPFQPGSPWISRSMLRVVRSLPTGSAYLANATAVSEAATGRGTASVVGTVFADWNGNGVLDAGDAPLEGIPMRIGAGNVTTSGRDGQFSFLNVPAGERDVGLDTAALPIDFDPPEIANVQLALTRGDTRRVSFGLIPLGTVTGRVMRDANRNGRVDPGEEPLDGAIVVLDAGARSEQVRAGRFRFEAVRSGAHRVKLLLESLPDGAVISGEAELPADITRDHLSIDIPFLVTIEKRPEIRRVFPPRGGGGAASARGGRGANAVSSTAGSRRPGARPTGSRTASASGSAAARGRAPAAQGGTFAIQIAALNDPTQAQALVRELTANGLAAYINHPGPSDPSPYRIRVGPYTNLSAAAKAVSALEQRRGEKLWVVREK